MGHISIVNLSITAIVDNYNHFARILEVLVVVSLLPNVTYTVCGGYVIVCVCPSVCLFVKCLFVNSLTQILID